MPDAHMPEDRAPDEKKPAEDEPGGERAEATGPAGGKPPASDVSFRPIKIVAGVAGAVVALFVGAVLVRQHLTSPGYLVARLRGAEGEKREALVMRLNLSRGDVVTPMIKALRDSEAPADYRADILELLFKKYNRAADERIEAALVEALADAEPDVRRAAVYGFAVYMRREQQLAVLDLIDDPDAEVRRQVYMVLNSGGRRGRRRRRGGWGGLWGLVSDESRAELKEKLLATARRRAREEEPDSELAFLARAIVGREIEGLCDEATEAAQRSDLARAEELFARALELDPTSHQARVRTVRHHLAQGDRERALALAREYGALIRIPMLSSAPVIDGDPSDPVWDEAFRSEDCFRGTSRWVARPTEGRMSVRAGHAGGKIFIAVFGYEDDLDALVVKRTARDSDVWRDDCVELFFDPVLAERTAFQFVINAGGAIFDLFAMDKRKNFECETGAKVFRDRGYWGCEFAVAAAELNDAKITPESIWGVNFMRTRIGPASEQGALWPTYGHSHRYNLYPLAVFDFPEGSSPAPTPAPSAPENGREKEEKATVF